MSRALNEQLQRSRAVLQVWEIYARLAASFSERLQKLQRDVEAELSRAPTDDNTVEQIAVKIHNVQVKQLKHRKRISPPASVEFLLQRGRFHVMFRVLQSEGLLLSEIET